MAKRPKITARFPVYNTETAAVVTIHRAGAMTKAGRRRLADWLRRQAAAFMRDGARYSTKRFTARYRCR